MIAPNQTNISGMDASSSEPAEEMEPLSLECRAYHEAGHCVLAYVLGMEIDLVSITGDEDKNVGGHTDFSVPLVQFRKYFEQPDGSFKENARGRRLVQIVQYRKLAVISYGGFVAVRIWADNSGAFGFGRDFVDLESASREAFYRLMEATGCEYDMDQARSLSMEAFGRLNKNWLACRARDALRLELRHWQQIEAVAAALLHRETLSEEEAIWVIRRAVPFDSLEAMQKFFYQRRRAVHCPPEEQ